MRFSILFICAALVALVCAQSIEFNVEVVPITVAHPFFGLSGGISSGYKVNGVEGRPLTLTAGRSYTFKTTGLPCNHPLHLTTSEKGGFAGRDGALKAADGVSLSTGTLPADGIPTTTCAATSGTPANLVFTPPTSMIGQTVYYQCTLHQRMGGAITIVEETFCEKYARLTEQTELELMTDVITTTVTNILGNDLLKGYFDGTGTCRSGTCPAVSDAAKLIGNLVAFFGAPLGCNEAGFPQYTGRTDMTLVHSDMIIDVPEFNEFNNVVKATLKEKGVTEEDAEFVRGFLEASFKNTICNDGQCRTSICDRYSDGFPPSGISNEDLLKFLVDAAITALVDPSSIVRKYFDGTAGPNFLTNAAALASLKESLINFFWVNLGCTDEKRTFDMSTFRATHQALKISQEEADFFNGALVSLLGANGVSAADQAVVAALLKSLDKDVVFATPAPPASVTADWTISVGAKDENHQFNGVGFSAGFKFQKTGADASTAVFIKELCLVVGERYRFRNSAGCLHPFYFTTSATGAGDAELLDGMSSTDYTQVCGGQNDLIFTPTIALKTGPQLYFNCRVHENMGGLVKIVSAQSDCGGAAPTPSGPPPPTVDFVLTVAPKTNHPFTDGFGSGYVVNGEQGKTLDLKVGQAYTFRNDGGCTHPLYISTSPNGANADPVTSGVTSSDLNQVCGGENTLTFTPTNAHRNQYNDGTDFFYQCRVHTRMGGVIRICSGTNCDRDSGLGPDTGAAGLALSFFAALFALIAVMF